MVDLSKLSELSDEELEELEKKLDVTTAPAGEGYRTLKERNAVIAEKDARKTPRSKAVEIEPSAWRRGLAAFGGALYEPVKGAMEKIELMFPGASPEAAQDTRKRIAAERSERRDVMRSLEDTTAGQVGAFAGKALPFVFASPSVGGQTAMAGALGFLSGGPDKPENLLNELTSSAFQGALDAAATGAITKGIQLGHKAVQGARGIYTPEGQTAMRLDKSVNSLGLPPATIGQLDPLAPDVLRAHPELTLRQAAALEQKMASQHEVPSLSGGTEVQTVPGGKLKEGIQDAIKKRAEQARQMYAAVDAYAQQNGLPNIPANYTVNVLASANRLTPAGKPPTGNNIVYNLLDTYDPDAFAWLKQAGDPKKAKAIGMTMTQYHDARVAVGRALNALERKNPADLTSDQIEAKQILKELKAALDNDVERWAKANADNKEAMSLYNRAKEFYANVAAPAINNPLARKAASVSRGWNSAESMYAALTNPLNRSLVDRLLPTASPETVDMLNVLQNLPDVGAVVAKGSIPQGGANRELGALARGVAGRPVLAAMELAPGLRWLSSTTPAKRVYFGQPPGEKAWRVYGPAAQYPAGALERWAQERTTTGRNP